MDKFIILIDGFTCIYTCQNIKLYTYNMHVKFIVCQLYLKKAATMYTAFFYLSLDRSNPCIY